MFLKPLRVLFGLLGTLLGASWSLLGRSWAVLGRNWVVLDRLLGTSIFDDFLDRCWEQKGYPKGGILGAKTEPKSIQNRGRNLRAKKLCLGGDLGRFGVVLGAVLG